MAAALQPAKTGLLAVAQIFELLKPCMLRAFHITADLPALTPTVSMLPCRFQQNHELLQQSDHLVKQQAAMIVQLEQQLLAQSPARAGSSGAGAAATARRLVELERENERLRAEVGGLRRGMAKGCAVH